MPQHQVLCHQQPQEAYLTAMRRLETEATTPSIIMERSDQVSGTLQRHHMALNPLSSCR